MMFEYHTNFYGIDMLLGAIFGVVFMVGAAVTLALFLLKGFGLSRIARRRGLKHAWLSWIPVGQDWIRGSLSDQYKYLTAGKVRSRRKILTVLSAAFLVLNTAYIVTLTRHLSLAMMGFGHPMHSGFMGYHMAHVIFTGGAMGFVVCCVGIARTVWHHMCMYDIYSAGEPQNNLAMTVLGVIIPLLEPFFLIYIKEKDEGMPRRRDTSAGSAQTERPADPVYETPSDGPEQL